ncbi:response regulator [Desulfobacterales bacterium HSG2]|nr:response regulator [Desulfobacterales bacterium HSG2]
MNEEELLKRLREAFNQEAEERLASLSASLLEFEESSAGDKHAALETAFREAHSLKGAARAVNLTEIETLCQSIESVFAELKQDAVPLSPGLFDILHSSVRSIENFLAEESVHNKEEIESLVCRLEDLEEESVENRESETENRESETENRESETENRESETENRESETENRESETENRESETKNRELETKNRELETKNRELETGNRKPETGNRKPETGNRKPETGNRKPETGNRKPLISETIRISTSKLDAVLLEAEELASLKLILSQRVLNLRDVMAFYDQWKKKWSRVEPEYRLLRNRLSVQKTEQADDARKSLTDGSAVCHQLSDFGSSLAGLMAFLDWNQEHIHSLGCEIRELTKSAEQDQRILSRMADDLLNDMKKVMMLPFSTLFGIFPRMLRDIARNQGKEAELVLEGGDIEIDRRILEEMKDPLIHLLRNAVDHGLEEPETRLKHQKQRRGTIKLAISQVESSKVEILFSDDGRGIDIDRVRDKAVKSGIISEKEAERLKENEALSLIFRSGFSSSSIITEISGRGLGLAIVQEKVENLGGLLFIETEFDQGSSFRIQLPVTLATFRGVLVRVGAKQFIVPVFHVERVLKISQDRVQTVKNMATIPFGGDVLPLADLANVLGVRGGGTEEFGNSESVSEFLSPSAPHFLTVMVLGTGQKRVAFKVSEIICEQEVFLKSLGKQLSRVPNIAGATILGSGKVVPVLNVYDLLKSPLRADFKPVPAEIEKTGAGKDEIKKKQSVLIAEDSITSRMLIKNILETAGYSVKTAVDGRDAYTMIKTEPFDVVVSDVEMPRMNGFELTAKIRGNSKLAETPVVLVTSLDSREDRERGIDVGANAYIVKGSFDQSNLLEVISRLI